MAKCNKCAAGLKRNEKDLCVKCQRDLENANAPLIDELLMYANFHKNGATKELLVRTMSGFFTNIEIVAAKSLLYERFGNLNILVNGQNRRDSENRTELMAICCDIVDDLFKLEENDVTCVCCAKNWKRVPKMAPEECTNISTADKLAQFEAKMHLYDNALSEIRIENYDIKSRVLCMEKKYGENKIDGGWPALKSNRETNNTSGAKIKSPVSRPTAELLQTAGSIVQNVPAANQGTHGTNATARQPNVAESAGTGPVLSNNTHENHQTPDRPWNVQGSHRRNRDRVNVTSRESSPRDTARVNSRYQPRDQPQDGNTRVYRSNYGIITGSSRSGGLRATTLPIRDFFVYRLNSEDDSTALSDYMKSKDITPRDIVPKQKQGSTFNSFKVTVDVTDAEKMMNPDTWQYGVCVKKWRDYNLSRN